MKKKTIGILAHVDAGKTTLSEAILYNRGVLKSLGRIDHGNTFLDTDNIERSRGITVYSKNARFMLSPDEEVILMDTPGHVDFTSQMSQVLAVLDAAVLLISAPMGIQSHTRKLFSLLSAYNIPTVVFVNKIDMPCPDKAAIISSLNSTFEGEFVDFTQNEDSLFEDIATISDCALNEYMETGAICDKIIKDAVVSRKLFPCYFGSALRNEGIDEMLETLSKFTPCYESKFPDDSLKAVCYKVAKDKNKMRLCHLKILNGSLHIRENVNDDKVTELRLYNSVTYESVKECSEGEICAVCGLDSVHIGDTIGGDSLLKVCVPEPVMRFKVNYPEDTDSIKMLSILRELEDEDLSLNVTSDENTHQILVSLMGDIEGAVLSHTVKERFGIDITFSEGRVNYKESISASCEGVGHFEPLRHYAEVHLRLDPLERGSGLRFETDLSEDDLSGNYQRLILTHLSEKTHRGVLINAPLTDMKITLVAGKAHLKHTEGGDFRQATYRAVRQGLMNLLSSDECFLLEPYYEYSLYLPSEYVGRAMTDITQNFGTCEVKNTDDDNYSELVGISPVVCLNTYAKDVAIYTKGLGSLTFSPAGYYKCHNEEEVLEQFKYNPDEDTGSPSSSVFCSHGAGVIIPWYEVPEHMHLPYSYDKEDTDFTDVDSVISKAKAQSSSVDSFISSEEIDRILNQTGNANEGARHAPGYKKRKVESVAKTVSKKTYNYDTEKKEHMVLVDGYNLIHANERLSSLSQRSLDGAALSLNDMLANYAAIKNTNVTVVYDAYKVKGGLGQTYNDKSLNVVYTKEAQTADNYIERFTHENKDKYDITVITSDGIIQTLVRGQDAKLMSSREFWEHLNSVSTEFNEQFHVSGDEDK